jgi:hypothetical protein
VEFAGDCAQRFLAQKGLRPSAPVLNVGLDDQLSDLFEAMIDCVRKEAFSALFKRRIDCSPHAYHHQRVATRELTGAPRPDRRRSS